MNLNRREFMQMLAVASAAGMNLAGCKPDGTQKVADSIKANNASADMYEVPVFGNVHILHYTDCHAQLVPVYFREPSVNLGIGAQNGQVPHLVGDKFLAHFGVKPNTPEAHAYTYLNFSEAAQKFGKVGGFAHLATLVKKLKASRPGAVLLDGGDTWQGSATSLWSNGQDMIDAQKLLGVDIMTSHWEATYGKDRMTEVINGDFADAGIDFVANNIIDTDYEEDVFKPYVIREMNGVPVAFIGQAFPYTPIANPRYMTEGWSFGIRPDKMQEAVDAARGEGAQVVVVLSHNGMDVDLKMASEVDGIDAIMGGHTHDAVPTPTVVTTPNGGKTLVGNSGSNSKYLSVLDFDVRNGKVQDFRFKMLPIFSNFIEADAEMLAYIEKVRTAKYSVNRWGFGEVDASQMLNQVIAKNDAELFRRGNFTGTWDQLICDALIEVRGAEISFSPGFRWGTSLIPGADITYDDMMTQLAMTYPGTTLSDLTGEQIKFILEDVCDNLFNVDPYYQQGGDMVRVGGLKYAVDPTKGKGERITDMELNGKPLEASKKYKVAGWANVSDPNVQIDTKTYPPVWEVVETYLRDKKHITKVDLNEPVLKGVTTNPGLA